MLAALLLIVGFIVLALAKKSASTAPMRRLTVGGAVFSIEVADTAVLRARGLSGHAPLGEREGMLFLFAQPTAAPFWMQGMLFPIDFVWIAGGRVIGITERALPMEETGFKMYWPPAAADQVLEISAGAAQEFGIGVGDAVSL
jgi:uncharacterized membrane protein (UPF0127 family)